MKTIKILYFFIAVTLFISTIYSQDNPPRMMSLPEGGYEFANDVMSVTIPFKISDNLIVIEMELNNIIYNLVLDTGMPIAGAVLFGSPKADSANLTFSGQIQIGGVDGKVIPSDLSMGAVLKVPNLSLTNQMIIVMPKDEKRSLHFQGKDGVIGFSFFSKLIIELDYENKKMIVSKPAFFDPENKGEKIPIEVRGNRIFVKAQVNLEKGSPINTELVLDTGNRSALVLNTNYRPEIILPTKYISYYASSLSGKMLRKAGRIKNIQLGNYKLSNIISSFNDGTNGAPPPWEKEGNLGSEILKRFNVTFNIPGKQIYLKKNNLFSEPFEFNMAGLQFDRDNEKAMVVTNVIPGSPSDKAQILPGDKIIAINDKLSSQLTRDEIENELKFIGKEVNLIISRSNKKLTVSLILTRFI